MASKNGTDPAHEAPVEAPPVEAEEASVAAEQPVSEPQLEVTSMDYWRQMTQRQVERLQNRVDELEAEAGPLRQQINSLKLALSATAAAASAPKSGWAAKQQGVPITEEEKNLVRAMAREGKSTEEVRARLPHVKSAQVYSYLYGERQRMQR